MNDDQLDDLVRRALAAEAKHGLEEGSARATSPINTPGRTRGPSVPWLVAATCAVLLVVGGVLAALHVRQGGSERVVRTAGSSAESMATCAGEPIEFPAHVLTDPAPDPGSLLADPPGQALQRFRADPSRWAPTSDIFRKPGQVRPLSRTADLVVYAVRIEGIDLFVNAARTRGGWEVSGWGNCNPTVPNTTRIMSVGSLGDQAATTISVQYAASGCGSNAGGTAPTIDVKETETTITITVYEPDPITVSTTSTSIGAPTPACGDSSILRPATVHLKAPVGHRTVLDGRTIPPSPPGS